ncbi:GNAT family N-acetyltransferase [Rhodanobacter umsongensis]|uniref:GNAT family N-acetyltransferase n=1 Tax=Rhodanobacter umsongensis TaxID=633153 RepID=A0ABW0JKI8_9GAMM
MAGLTFRPALAGDVDAAVPLIHSSGPAAFEFVFAVPGVGDAQAFLRQAFVDGAGEFGWRNHVVGLLDGEVVAVGAAYGGDTKWSYTRAAARQILGHYGWRHAAGVITRGLKVESVIPPPSGAMYYLAHLGVSGPLRGRGVGTALVHHLLAQPAAAGCPAVLDVATTNPDAQRLYQRLGFAVIGERRSTLANAQGCVADHRRMQWHAPAQSGQAAS